MKSERKKALLDATKAICTLCNGVNKASSLPLKIGPAKFEEWEEFSAVTGKNCSYSGWRHLIKHEYGRYPYSIRCMASPIHELIKKEK
jgi:hypothetical protein